MDKLILQLLKDNGRIIIPDFGALIVKQKSPFKVIFNEFLQYNDGALINALSELEGISKEDAAKKIKKLTLEFSSKLDSGQPIELEEIGILVKTQTGKINLSESIEDIPKPQQATQKKKEDNIEFEVPSDKQKKTEANKPKETKPVTPKPPEQKTKPAPEKVEAPKPKVSSIPKPSTTFTTDNKIPSSPYSTAEKPGAPIQEYYTEGSKKNWKSIFLWTLLILIVNGAIFGFFFFGDEIKALIGKDKEETVKTDVEIFDLPEEEQIAAVDSESFEAPDELVIEGQTEDVPENQINEEQILPGTKYYVVAGVFKEESNADNLVRKLRNKGYNAEKFDRIGRMHAVSYDVFPSKREADNYMMKIKREINPDTWIRIID